LHARYPHPSEGIKALKERLEAHSATAVSFASG
jgi:hypothetical protein